jgi:predicted nucleic acid-binding Zn ribbon protein
MTEKLCPVCEKPVPPSKTRPRVFCSHRCRTKAFELEVQIANLMKRLATAEAQWQRVKRALSA